MNHLLEVYPAPLKRVRNALGESLKNFITGGIVHDSVPGAGRVNIRPRWRHAGYRARWLAVVIPLVLVVFALTLTVPRLTTPSVYVFDELYYAYTAGKYVTGDEAYSTAIPPREDPAIEWTHPPLAKLLIAGGILVAGDNPLGWRIASLLSGSVGVVIAYLLALSLTGSRATSGVAAGLLLLDGLYLVESRTGMSNLFVLVFVNGALLALSRALRGPARARGTATLATGLFVGLGLATKWSGVALAGMIGLVVCWRMVQIWRLTLRADESAAALAPAGLRAHLRWAPIALVAIPCHHLPRLVSAFLAHRARLGRLDALAPRHACLPPRSGHRA